MGCISVSDFFIEQNRMCAIEPELYQSVDSHIATLKAVSRLSYKSFYIIDYYKQNFLYVSDNPLFLAGYSMDEVRMLGFNFYIQTLTPEDLQKLININRAGFAFLYRYQQADWMRYMISYNLQLYTAKKEQLLVNHQLTPLRISPDGHLWLAVCAVSLPTTLEAHDAYITCTETSKRYALKSNHHEWIELDSIELKKEEQMVIRLASQGYSTNAMASTMYKSINTIKKYRKDLFEKLGVSTINEAITYATLYKLV